ncbi:hypothetical protein ACFWBC_03490 [Streptomyces sp. NPDC059985]|uniref:hypothetical protein n=1 Tax=Streptomyces sp. NPDC059985 TaxID=3347025 RepID=UPI00369FA1BC
MREPVAASRPGMPHGHRLGFRAETPSRLSIDDDRFLLIVDLMTSAECATANPSFSTPDAVAQIPVE